MKLTDLLQTVDSIDTYVEVYDRHGKEIKINDYGDNDFPVLNIMARNYILKVWLDIDIEEYH